MPCIRPRFVGSNTFNRNNLHLDDTSIFRFISGHWLIDYIMQMSFMFLLDYIMQMSFMFLLDYARRFWMSSCHFIHGPLLIVFCISGVVNPTAFQLSLVLQAHSKTLKEKTQDFLQISFKKKNSFTQLKSETFEGPYEYDLFIVFL